MIAKPWWAEDRARILPDWIENKKQGKQVSDRENRDQTKVLIYPYLLSVFGAL
jgi:hypothetical protein